MSRKVLFITPQPFFIERGSPYRVRAEVQAIVENGFEVDLLSYDFGKNLEIKNVRSFRSFRPFWIKKVGIGFSWNKVILDLFLFFSILSLIIKNKYAAIHGVEEAGVMASFLSLFTKTPYIFDMHSHMSEQLSQCIVNPNGMFYKIIFSIEKSCIKRAAGIITVSDLITARIRNYTSNTPAITLDDLPLDNSINKDSKSTEIVKSKLKLNNTTNIVYTGNFEPYQGIDLLLYGFSEFLKLDSENHKKTTRLIIVGGGEDNDPKFKFYLEETKKLNISDCVIFTGQKSEDEVSDYMNLADFLISPRIAGANTPLKIYSYIAARKPIIATAITSHINVLNHNNSFLAEPTKEDLGKTFAHALNSTEEERTEKIKKASLLLEQRFNKKEFSRRIGLIYKAALGQEISEEVLIPAQKLIANTKQ